VSDKQPHDPIAESSVLGAILISARAISEVEDVLQPADFYEPKHEAIYGAMLALATRGEPTDPMTVLGALRTRGDLDRIGGPAYLHTLASAVPTAANVGYYAAIVHERATLRRLLAAGTRIAQLAQVGLDGSGGGEVDDIVSEAHAEMAKLSGDSRASQDVANFGDRVDDIVNLLDEPLATDTGDFVQTGFADLDRLFCGLRPGQVTVVAGRPAMGKSTLCRDFSRHVAFQQGKRVLLHTLEMSREEVELCILAAECKVDLRRLRTRIIGMDEMEKIGRARDRMEGSTLVIDGTPNLTLSSLRSSIRRHKPDVVVVDQLQLMTPTSTRKRGAESRQEEVGALSRGIKLMAKAENVPVIICSKLNRGPEQRPDKKPQMSDLRDSGDIESDADTVILLHREDAYEQESPRAGEADFIVAKHRNGPTDTITVAFQGHYSRFVDMADGAPPPRPARPWSPSDALRLVQP
jgi:replicative DNA helicase